MYDLIVRSSAWDVAVADGVIAAVGSELEGSAREEVDARELVVLPGAVDAHVHLNDPGRADWEGFATGTTALAAGGTTTAIDMPLNAIPPTLDAASFAAKAEAARGVARVDVALWGGLTPGPLDRLDELAACGVVGFKAFMSASGVEEFEAADDVTLLEGMARAAALGLPVAVHAESDAITSTLAARAVAEGRTAMADYLASRPVVAELEAIARAILFAEETGCALHVVHVSTGRGVALVAAARARGVNVSCETCPHYLVFDADDAVAIGTAAKCAPPLRPRGVVEELWARVLAGDVDLIATDHSPSPAALKETGGDAFAAWGGIPGAQTLLSSMYSEGVVARGLSLERLALLTAAWPAARFGLTPSKGTLTIGADADIVLLDPRADWTVTVDDLLDRHKLSPFADRTFHGRVVRTILRGQTVFVDGALVGEPIGRVIRP
ncbi:allantoinase AllB [Baekduia sp. Peel2402]|uniref:allantoinase AllB n=1 Tax=Baekduia sp. Peel2402 TaxID=3458296 RepID=UPI00403E6C94